MYLLKQIATDAFSVFFESSVDRVNNKYFYNNCFPAYHSYFNVQKHKCSLRFPPYVFIYYFKTIIRFTIICPLEFKRFINIRFFSYNDIRRSIQFEQTVKFILSDHAIHYN